jgi:hypothetical protein
MIDEQTILTSERLRDDLLELRKSLRSRYPKKSKQVVSENPRSQAARLAETWLVELVTNDEVAIAIGSATIADLSVEFQRLLTFSEHATTRSKYESALENILDNYSMKVILPLKQLRGRGANQPVVTVQAPAVVRSAFVGQSFATSDRAINQCVTDILEALGVKVVTGEKPKADSVSEKVKRLIDDQSVFVGVFTRRDKIARKPEWTTSTWVIDEKAYALGRRKPLVLIKEQGVGSIGGIQGDYEFIEFDRTSLEKLALKLIQLFDLTNNGFLK